MSLPRSEGRRRTDKPEFCARMASVSDDTQATIGSQTRGISLSDGLSRLADVCKASADFMLGQFAKPEEPSIAQSDVDWCIEHMGTKDPAIWIADISYTYVAESAHLCRSVSSSLRDASIVTPIYSGARGIAERIGRLKWILDGTTPYQRAKRAALERAVCLHHYASSVKRLKAEKVDQKATSEELAKALGFLDEHFEVERPPEPTKEQRSGPWRYPEPHDPATWLLDGEAYPTYGKVMQAAIEGGSNISGPAFYAAISGLTHPNVSFSGEHRFFTTEGSIGFGSGYRSYEVPVRLAVLLPLVGGRAISDWVSATGSSAVEEKLDELGEALDSIGVEFGDL